jgi:transposase
MLRIVYGDSAMSKSNVFKWHKRFREGREDVYDDERQGAPVRKRTNENVEKIRELVQSGRRLSYRMIADELGMSKETVRIVLLKDLCIGKLETKSARRDLANKESSKPKT